VTSALVRPARSVSAAGNRMSSRASASAGTWLRAWFWVRTRARVTVVRQTSSAGAGYLASRLATLDCSLPRALSPSQG
jgi:hypothetical protein